MTKKTRRRFSREFKMEAVRQLQAGARLVDVSRNLDVDPTVLRRWQDQVTVDPETACPGNGLERKPEKEITGRKPSANVIKRENYSRASESGETLQK